MNKLEFEKILVTTGSKVIAKDVIHHVSEYPKLNTVRKDIAVVFYDKSGIERARELAWKQYEHFQSLDETVI